MVYAIAHGQEGGQYKCSSILRPDMARPTKEGTCKFPQWSIHPHEIARYEKKSRHVEGINPLFEEWISISKIGEMKSHHEQYEKTFEVV